MEKDNTLIVAIVSVFLIFFLGGFGMMGFGGMMMPGFYYGFGFFGWFFMILIITLLVLLIIWLYKQIQIMGNRK